MTILKNILEAATEWSTTRGAHKLLEEMENYLYINHDSKIIGGAPLSSCEKVVV